VSEKLYMENTLLRVAGALFLPRRQTRVVPTQEIVLNRGVRDKNIVVRPIRVWGNPARLLTRSFVAILKKHSDYGRPAQSDVSFSRPRARAPSRPRCIRRSRQRRASCVPSMRFTTRS